MGIRKDDKNLKSKPLKLEDFSKENPFSVPEGYFEELPCIIQAKVIAAPERVSWLDWALIPAHTWKISLAAVAVILTIVFSGIFQQSDLSSSVEDILAEVSMEDLIEYIEYSDLSTDEILAELNFIDIDSDFLMSDEIQLLNVDDLDELDFIYLYEEYGIEDDLF